MGTKYEELQSLGNSCRGFTSLRKYKLLLILKHRSGLVVSALDYGMEGLKFEYQSHLRL